MSYEFRYNRLSLESVKHNFEKVGCELLEDHYENNYTPMKYKCSCGNEEAYISFKSFQKGHRCSKCGGNKKLTLEEIKEKVKELNNYEILSTEYINSTKKLIFKCDKGHIFESTWGSIQQGHKCRFCMDQLKRTIDDVYKIVEKREGKCLSTEMENRKTPLLFECKEGHQWWGNYVNINHSWCPECGRKRTTESSRRTSPSITDIQKILNKIEMEIDFSEEFNYINRSSPIKIKCKNGHSYHSYWNYIKEIKGCRYCTHQVNRTLEECQEKAKEKGGKCLSTEYIPGKVKLLWRCKFGHEWKATADSILNGGHWCPTCSKGLGERICREFFEQIFKKPFLSVKPSWLLGPNGGIMQLDGYNEELNLAFEHDGEQHNRITTIYTKTKEALVKRKLIDKTKNELCKKNGITLIRIPEVQSKIKIEELKEYLELVLSESDIVLPENFNDLQINLTKVYDFNHDKFYLDKYKKVAENKEWKIISDYYNGYYGKLKIICNENHEFEMAPDALMSTINCPICYKIKRGYK